MVSKKNTLFNEVKEYRFLEHILDNPKTYLKDTMRALKMNNIQIHKMIDKFKGIILVEKEANRFVFNIDYKNPVTTAALGVIHYNKFNRLPFTIKKALLSYIESLTIKPLLVILFGSYAKGTNRSDSDLDVFLVYNSLSESKEADRKASVIKGTYGVELNPVYLDYQSFKESFHNASKKFYKKLNENNIVLIGMEYWRQLKNEQ